MRCLRRLRSGEDVARLTYFGLHALQHRGQESAGIAVGDGETVTVIKNLGLVSRVFKESDLDTLTGDVAIGHTRYSTTGSSTSWENAQPMLSSIGQQNIALAHNGNLVNVSSCATAQGQRRAIPLDDRLRGHRDARRPLHPGAQLDPARHPRHDEAHPRRVLRSCSRPRRRSTRSAIRTASVRSCSASSMRSAGSSPARHAGWTSSAPSSCARSPPARW